MYLISGLKRRLVDYFRGSGEEEIFASFEIRTFAIGSVRLFSCEMMFLALVLGFGSSSATPLDISGDGKVKKVVLQEGTGKVKPTTGQKVEIKYEGWLADGKAFDSSNNKGGTFTFVVGRGVIPAWSMAIQTMTVGEKAKITVDYQYGYGERGYPPIIPARSELTFELELVKIL
jgi:hypothetical protein